MIAEPIITIYGPGLLGGSLALALQEQVPQSKLRLWARRKAAAQGILDRGIQAEFYTDATAAAEGASLIVLCTPVETMASLAQQIIQAELAPDCIVTDVGSVKGSVVQALLPIFGSRFIGSHPMAGSEKTGIDAARADLFKNAVCLVTPSPEAHAQALSRLHDFWQTLGCRVLEMSPEEHDVKVARISHLPHMMAVVTTLAALRSDPEAVACVANGFRDTTRVSGGDPSLWTGIAMENRPALLAQLQTASDTLTELLEILRKPDEEELRRFLAEAQSLRRTVPAAVS